MGVIAQRGHVDHGGVGQCDDALALDLDRPELFFLATHRYTRRDRGVDLGLIASAVRRCCGVRIPAS
ncbi:MULTISPECIES: hypothetical protein [unclassified Rhizobium]|uniref:hypothetical protein n=1 Tax=unclassified Rhizobium TaxID=2613769 RepID=UPI0010AADDE8|nr:MULTISPECIES: hypothetical protein [unclassified Rhizobium]TIX93513.1 hypothetical protein BSK43_001050 [Rhizobium sp. P44RR-XXIV]